MAAIQALVINESTLSKERHGSATPTTPKASMRATTPRPSDAAASTHSDAQPNIPAMTLSELPIPPAGPPSIPVSIASKPPDAIADTRAEDSMAIDLQDDDDEEGSGEDTEGGDGSSRKKKGQRFFCTGYPPCSLSFTRSEHLARHIRKHTGERPFQCHCNRRFSRLDNLRQHAQTVHVNEEIPGDSLAATGTRYQRQIRTDRVRPPPRPRTNTMSSAGTHSRGHSRNLSTSSIGSTTSAYSMTSTARQRPAPLMMNSDARPSTPPLYSTYTAHSPNDMTTPTSATFPTTPGSPNFASVLGSPVASASRTVGGGFAGAQTPGRRLSVPSSANPFQGSNSMPFSASYTGPGSGPGPAVPSNSSVMGSPTSTMYSPSQGYSVPPGDDWRRRTWHPSTYSHLNFNYARPATSGLTYSQTPDAPHGTYAQNATAAAGQAQRLPGIESFDHVAQQRPHSPPKRNASPMEAEYNRHPGLLAAPDIESHRRGPSSWEPPRSSQYPEIDDVSGRPSTSWGQQTIDQIHHVSHRRHQSLHSTMGPPPPTITIQHPQQMAQEALQLQTSNKRVRRSGWHGNSYAQRTSPEDSSSSDGIPTPGTSAAEMNPVIMHSNGFIEPQLLGGDAQNTPCLPQPMEISESYGGQHMRQRTASMSAHSTGSSELNRLEALVAVATSESNAPSRK